MKRINAYKKLFQIENQIELAALKQTYRALVKQWHPDKFQQDDEKAQEAEVKSLQVIDAYHFLVSIAPETKEANIEEYNKTIESGIEDYQLKSLLLKVTFGDGCTYEYFGVNKNLFQKLINVDNQNRFSNRNIFNSFLYRKSKKGIVRE